MMLTNFYILIRKYNRGFKDSLVIFEHISELSYSSELHWAMSAIIIILLIFCSIVDGCPIVNTVNGSCCEITSNKFSFTIVANKPRVYNITNFCGDCEEVAEG